MRPALHDRLEIHPRFSRISLPTFMADLQSQSRKLARDSSDADATMTRVARHLQQNPVRPPRAIHDRLAPRPPLQAVHKPTWGGPRRAIRRLLTIPALFAWFTQPVFGCLSTSLSCQCRPVTGHWFSTLQSRGTSYSMRTCSLPVRQRPRKHFWSSVLPTFVTEPNANVSVSSV